MCGITGYKVDTPVDSPVLGQMMDALVHRGPDAAGEYHSGSYHAGMRRLAINDLHTGDQPLFNADKSVVLLYNGEIYNYPALRKQLEAKGYVFTTHSDGEVICHLYDEYGEDLFEHLDGMFAVALWIEPEQKLLLARDIPGEKPLYYAQLSHNEIVFGSEIKSLRQFPTLDLTLNRQAIWDYPTFLWIPEPASIYNEVMALDRGHMLIVDSAGITLRRYANRFNLDEIDTDMDAVIEETRQVVSDAVYSRLLSDVPVGSFLSGGLDSSIVATLAARELGEINTFSVGFEDVHDPYHGRADESVYAQEHANRIGSRHHAIHVTADTFRADLDRFCTYGDQPFAVSSGLGILAIAHAAQEADIKVLLSGDGADECFGGYSWYAHMNQLPACTSPQDNDGIVSFQNFGDSLDKRLSTMGCYSAQERAWSWHYYAHEKEKASLFNPEWSNGLESSLRHFHQFKQDDHWQPEDYIAQDREFYFPNEMLRKVDRMTMACSVEGRVPFAAPSVLSHADKLRYQHMIHGGKLKWVLRKAFSDVLPDDIIDRPKHGFNVPIDHWLKNEWADLMDETFATDSALSRHGIVQTDSRKTAQRMLQDDKRLNGHTLFSYIMLNRWLEKEHPC